MSAEAGQDDKQFDASEQKLRQAREKGDVPRSLELNSALVYLGWWAGLVVGGAVAVPAWTAMATRLLGSEGWSDHAGTSMSDAARSLVGMAAGSLLTIVGFMGLCVLVGVVVQRSLTFTPSRIAPDIKRINPVSNAGQKFGKSGLVTFAISLGKVSCVAFGGWYLYRSLLGRLMSSVEFAEGQWLSGMSLILHQLAYLALGISLVFAAIDLLWKNFDYRRRHRMSRKEMMDEHKESEGDPHFKAARRQKGFDLVMNRMLDDVERADVIIVNPTHYAVALEWKRGSGRSPLCLAKGVDDVARRIRERAAEHDIPIWSDPPCARALYATVDIGAEIDAEHFKAVATAIRFAEQVRKKLREGWREAQSERKAREAQGAGGRNPGGSSAPPGATAGPGGGRPEGNWGAAGGRSPTTSPPGGWAARPLQTRPPPTQPGEGKPQGGADDDKG